MPRLLSSFSRSTVTVLLGALVSLSAVAMGVRTDRQPIASGRDGSKLVEIRAFGPEGGGSLAYAFEGGPKPSKEEYLLSSNFSPGGSERPQRVTPSDCVARLEALEKELARRGYSGVLVDPRRCEGKERSGLVTVKAEP